MKHQNALLSASLVAVVLTCVYAGRLTGPFMFDDQLAIIDNPTLQSFALFAPPRATPVARRPLVNATFALDSKLFGLSPQAFHATNLLIHGLCTLLAYACLRRLLRAPGLPSWLTENATVYALCIALVWCVHPMTSETVLYATQRTESCVALWYLGALWLLTREAQLGVRTWPWVLFCSVCGVASKEVFVTAPVVLWCCDRTFFAGSFREALRARRSYYLALTLPLAGFVLLRRGDPHPGYVRGPELDYVLAQARIVPGYIWTALWPVRPALDYGQLWPQHWRELAPWLVVSLCLLVASVWCVLHKPRFGFLAIWVLGILAPSSSLLTMYTEVGAERRFYLPLLGVLTYAFVAFGACLARFGAGVRALSVSTGVLVVLLGLHTHEYAANFQSVRAFWQAAIAARPDDPRAYYNLAVTLRDEGNVDAALRSFEQTLALQEAYGDAHTNLASLLVKRGEYAAALEHARRVAELAPDAAPIQYNLALTFMFNGQMRDAVQALERAVELAPDYLAARGELVQAYMKLGEVSAARRHASLLREYAAQQR